jgi:3-oxoacyl-(acyl-carrier-protein) synthase
MAALVNAFGFGGHNVALAFTEYAPEPANEP